MREPALCFVDLNGIFARVWFGEKEHEAATLTRMREHFDTLKSEYDKAYICLDSPPYFRKEIYPEYKGQRRKRSPGMKGALQLVINEAQTRFPIMHADGCEADDVIMTLVEQNKDFDGSLYVCSPDKDLLQTLSISNKVVVYNPHSGKEWDYQGFVDKYGFGPELFLEYQALMGDSADNVPGLKGIGPKKAAKIILEYGGADEAIVSGALGVRSELENTVKQIGLSRRLVGLLRDAEVKELESARNEPNEVCEGFSTTQGDPLSEGR